MVHVGLHSVETYHKKFGWENKKIKMYFAECPEMTLGKEGYRHSAKYSEIIFAECRPEGTRERSLCRVLGRGHSAKCVLKLKKIFVECQITATRQRIRT
jgi:hypothetical protein